MSDFLTVLLLAALPALGSVIGAGIAEWRQPPRWLTGAALHMAAGIATAVVAIELMPRALATADTWLLAIAFVVGAFASIGLLRLTRRVQTLIGGGDDVQVWMVFAAVAADLFIDGVVTGAGAAVSPRLAALVAVSQIAANIPGGFAVTARFRRSGAPRRQRVWMMALYPIAPLVAAIAGYVALRGASATVTGVALGLFSGLLLLATIEDLIPQADLPGAPRRISSPAYAAGFVGLMLISEYLGA